MSDVKIGSLVRLKESSINSVAYGEDFRDKVGIITDWTPAGANTPYGNDDYALTWGDGWIQWTHRADQDIVYEEDIVIVN
tara:strand:+ start:674 stop:913 length:240 start_codon:yes stop_codon:yes gene_type:complete